MNSTVGPRTFHMMILIGVLTTSTLISFTQSAALPYDSYERRDLPVVERPEIFLLFDQRMPGLENEMFSSGNDPVARTKRIGSLSIVNPLEVLRDRVRLELARRQALQDQRQIEANRRLLESIGKRSAPEFSPELTKIPQMDARKFRFAMHEQSGNRDEGASSNRMQERRQDWYGSDDADAIRDEAHDQTRRAQTNELRLL